MDEEHAAARTDTAEESPSGPTLTPVRRRGESHLLALMLAAAVIFVAAAIAKPWGQSAPPGASAASASLVAELATPSIESAPPPGASATTEFMPTEADQPVVIVVPQGQGEDTYTVVCAPDPGMSPLVVESGENVIGSRIVALVCTGANLQRLESVLPSPRAP
jgi:hypothetical protein